MYKDEDYTFLRTGKKMTMIFDIFIFLTMVLYSIAIRINLRKNEI